MPSGGSYLEGALDTLLPLHVTEIEVEAGVFPEKFGPGIDHGRLQLDLPVEKPYHLGNILHAIDIEIIDHGGFPHVGLGNNQPLEALFPRLDGNR